MGSLNAEGVWVYDDNDNIVPISPYMNLLSGSVSAALEDLRADLTLSDTGWVNITLASGVTAVSGETPQVRRIGSSVGVRGAATVPLGGGTIAVGTLPNSPTFNPGSAVEATGYLGSGQFYRGTISTAGAVATNNFTGTGTGTFRFSIFATFMK